MAEPARKLATELATDIVKRPAESLTTSGALKVGANKAGKAIGKVAPAIGKGFTLGSLLLNSSPSVAEPKPTDIVKPQKLEVKDPNAEEVPLWKQKTNAMKPGVTPGLLSWEDIVKSQGAKIQTSSSAVPGAEAKSTEDNQPTEDNSKTKEERKTRKENFQPEPPKEPETPIEPPAGGAKKTTPNRLSYNNLYSYYKSGGFGDPTSSDAKRDFGFAILNTIGSGLSNAGRGIKGQGAEAGYWDKILAQGKSNQTEFEMLDKQLANNEALQSYANNLRKDFEDYMLTKKIDLGSDEKKMEALKAFTAAYGNQLENDWLRMLGQAGINVGTSLGSAYLMNKMIR